MAAFDDVRMAIAPDVVPADERDIEMRLIRQPQLLGAGRGGDLSYVLVGPGQAASSSLRGQRFTFEPWIDLLDSGSGNVLRDVCVLRLWPLVDGNEVRSAISAVFSGLIDLASSAPNSLGAAIMAMESLFEAGLVSGVPRETEIGLAGELLMIAEAADPSGLVAMWHSKADSLFDFSAQGERLEVKTTTSTDRTHWFSSAQVRPIPGVCTTFASVVLPVVETGQTIAGLFASLTTLTSDELARVRSVIIDVTHEPPELLTSLVFDQLAAASSIRHLPASAVPAPTTAPGVGRIRWEASIDDRGTVPPQPCQMARSLGL